jgi:hypothetical protein
VIHQVGAFPDQGLIGFPGARQRDFNTFLPDLLRDAA